jgi:hypothetical protein
VQPLTPRPRVRSRLYCARYAPGTGRSRRSSVGTAPASSTTVAGGHAPHQLSAAPSSVTTLPLSERPSDDASIATSHPNSSIRPRRCSGTLAAADRQTASGYFRSDSVSNRPIAAATTDTPRSDHCDASSRVSASTAARAAPVCAIAGIPWCGDTVTLTTVPPPPSPARAPPAARVIVIVPSTFSRMTARQPLAAIASAGTKYCPPALLTSTSRRPWRSTADATIRSASDGTRMSPATHEHPSPNSEHAATSTSSRRPAITTRAPHASSSAAACRPRFVPPPVTIATRPSSSPSRKISDAPSTAAILWTLAVTHRPWDAHVLITESSTLAERLAALDAERFVGRDRELSLFDALFTEHPPAQVVLVHGPGGIGKSTLLREVARRGAARGWSPRRVDGRELAPAPGDIERAIGDLAGEERPLLLFDTYERMTAADAWLRLRLLPSLPARTVVVLAGRQPPDPAWFEGGWEGLATAMPLAGLPADASLALVRARGLDDDDVARRIVAWAKGSPLALSIGADATQRQDGAWTDEPLRDHPELVDWILDRVAHGELDASDFDVIAVAALARTCDQRMLRDVLPEVDAERAYAWLCHRSFSEHVGRGVALHDIVRQALRADLRARAPERERELRRRIADHLYARGADGGARMVIDLVELLENPAVRWGFGADGSTVYRSDLWRPEDLVAVHARLGERYGGGTWWQATEPLLREAPDRVATVRDASDRLCGLAIAVTPDNAPAIATDDPLLGPWLAHVRAHHDGEQVLVWRESLDLVAPGDLASPVLSMLNTAAILRSGLTNPRWSYIPIAPRNAAAVAFARAVNSQRLEHLDVRFGDQVLQCHLIDHGAAGMLGGVRDAVYAELGLAPEPKDAPGPHEPLTIDAVRDAFRALDHPLVLAASPLARGASTEERAISVRTVLLRAVDRAFGESPDEQLLRRVLERGYLDPSSSHEVAAHDLHVSRATYFRRLRVATRRVADFLVAERAA